MRSANRGIASKDWYVALSDTPVEVGGDDVEMIMREGRKWVKFEEHQQKMKALMEMWPEPPPATLTAKPAEDKPPEPIPPTPVAAEPPPAATEAPAPAARDGNAAVAEGGAAASPPSRLWLCLGGILLAFCAAFYFVWRKTEN